MIQISCMIATVVAMAVAIRAKISTDTSPLSSTVRVLTSSGWLRCIVEIKGRIPEYRLLYLYDKLSNG